VGLRFDENSGLAMNSFSENQQDARMEGELAVSTMTHRWIFVGWCLDSCRPASVLPVMLLARGDILRPYGGVNGKQAVAGSNLRLCSCNWTFRRAVLSASGGYPC